MMTRYTASRQVKGMSLIEIMVAVLLISFALLGLMALQARAVQFSVDSEDSTRAALLASELAATMWTLNTVSLPAAVTAAWQAEVSNATLKGLPGGTGTVTVNGNTATILIQWQPPRLAAATNRYVTDIVIPVIP
jgi:type IV pilus assembly protein PilV